MAAIAKKVLLPLLLFSLLSPRQASEEVVIEAVGVHETKRLIESDHIYLDVRTTEEFYQGHIKNSINVPFVFFTKEGRVKNPKFLEQVSAVVKKDDMLVLGCLSGVRSLAAAQVLTNEGFKNVKNFEGGYAAWESNGFDVMRKPHSEL